MSSPITSLSLIIDMEFSSIHVLWIWQYPNTYTDYSTTYLEFLWSWKGELGFSLQVATINSFYSSLS